MSQGFSAKGVAQPAGDVPANLNLQPAREQVLYSSGAVRNRVSLGCHVGKPGF
jgi:hypothetical protein